MSVCQPTVPVLAAVSLMAAANDPALPKGTWEVRGKRVQPQLIKNTALFTIEGELDDISGNGQTEAAHALCRNIPAEKRKHLLAVGVGHYGIFSGRKFREMISPQIGKLIRRHG